MQNKLFTFYNRTPGNNGYLITASERVHHPDDYLLEWDGNRVSCSRIHVDDGLRAGTYELVEDFRLTATYPGQKIEDVAKQVISREQLEDGSLWNMKQPTVTTIRIEVSHGAFYSEKVFHSFEEASLYAQALEEVFVEPA